MAEVINLADRRKAVKPTVHEIISGALEYVSSQWEHHAKRNTLNEYVADSLKTWSAGDENYIQGLNAIASVENMLGMYTVVKSPFHNQLGWRASFMMKNAAPHTPDLPFESYARCFNVLVYLKVKRDLQLYGMLDEL